MSYLRLYKGSSLQQQWKIDRDKFTIGRSRDNDIVLPSSAVSKRHAVILRDGHKVKIVDQGSANGIFVNSEKVENQTLKYWDEIQIFDYVIKYMAAARLPGEEEGAELDLNTEMRDESTKEILIADARELARLREEKRTAHLLDQTDQRSAPIVVNSANFFIGAAGSCHMRIRGWFKPRVAGQIKRRTNGFYLSRHGRGQISVNGRPVKHEIRLSDDDDLLIHKKPFKFYFRPLEGI